MNHELGCICVTCRTIWTPASGPKVCPECGGTAVRFIIAVPYAEWESAQSADAVARCAETSTDGPRAPESDVLPASTVRESRG